MPSNKTPLIPLIRGLHFVEDAILVGLLLAMIIMAVLQIFIRNFFDSGIFWGDGFVKVVVLWIGLMGAMIASRSHHHICMDVLSRFLPERFKRLSDLTVYVFTCIICALMTWHSLSFVFMEYQDGMTAFASVPVWICESIIPAAFGIMACRYLIFSVNSLRMVFRGPRS